MTYRPGGMFEPNYTVACTAGDTIRIETKHVYSSNPTAATKIFEFQLPKLTSGTLRIVFTLKASSSTSYGRIYKNGTAVGTLQSTGSTSYATFSEDIAGWSAGDLIQLYVYSDITGNVVSCDLFSVRAAGSGLSW